MEQRLRDVLGFQIGDGTAQIMKTIIARTRAGRQFGLTGPQSVPHLNPLPEREGPYLLTGDKTMEFDAVLHRRPRRAAERGPRASGTTAPSTTTWMPASPTAPTSWP
jgi:hypothetical protein